LKKITNIAVAVFVLSPKGIIEDDINWHIELDLGWVRINIDQVTLNCTATLKINNRGYVRYFNAWKASMNNAVDIQLAFVGQPGRFQLIAGATTGAVVSFT
jgi:hypothetical protein